MKHYRVEALAHKSDVWEAVYYADDLRKAKKYAAGLLRGGKVEAVRVVDTTSGEVNYELQHD